MIHLDMINGFLQHFIDTFYRKPEVCVRKGITPCSLQQAMINCRVKIEGAPEGNWMITNVLEKFKENQFMDIAKTMVADSEKYKCPIEVKSSILKATGLYLKDMIGSTPNLANPVLPIGNPSKEDLGDYAGLPSWSEDTVNAASKMEEDA